MSILNYDTESKVINLVSSFKDIYPNIDIYSTDFKDKFQEYIDSIITELNTIISEVKEDVVNNPKINLLNGDSITFSSLFSISNTDNINTINFLIDVFFNAIEADEVVSDTAQITSIICDNAEIGDFKINSDNISFASENITNNESNGSATIKNLTIENNLIVKGTVHTFVADEITDYSYDFGFMKISRTDGEVVIEFNKDAGLILSGSAYVGELRTQNNLVITEEYMSSLESDLSNLSEEVASKLSEFWDSVSVNDFIAKIVANSVSYFSEFNNNSFICETTITSDSIDSLSLDLKNAPDSSIMQVKKIMTKDYSGNMFFYGPGYDDTVLEFSNKVLDIPASLLPSDSVNEVNIMVVVTDESSNKSSTITFKIKA